MAEITAAAVMALREKTGLPMMECKKALQECGGDTAQAVEWLRKQGIKTQSLRADRETSCGRLAVFTDPAQAHNRWPLMFFALWSLIHIEGAEPDAALRTLLGEA